MSDGDNKKGPRGQGNSTVMDYTTAVGIEGMWLAFQCLSFLILLDPVFSKFLNKTAKEDEHGEVNTTSA